MGIVIPDAVDVSSASSAMQAVDAFIRTRRDEVRVLYRDAARLRRASGRPPHAGTTTSSAAAVVEVEPRADAVVFKTTVDGVEVDVWVFHDGGLMDDCDERTADGYRDAAIGAALRHIFRNSAEAAGLGLDVALLREFWT